MEAGFHSLASLSHLSMYAPRLLRPSRDQAGYREVNYSSAYWLAVRDRARYTRLRSAMEGSVKGERSRLAPRCLPHPARRRTVDASPGKPGRVLGVIT